MWNVCGIEEMEETLLDKILEFVALLIIIPVVIIAFLIVFGIAYIVSKIKGNSFKEYLYGKELSIYEQQYNRFKDHVFCNRRKKF